MKIPVVQIPDRYFIPHVRCFKYEGVLCVSSSFDSQVRVT